MIYDKSIKGSCSSNQHSTTVLENDLLEKGRTPEEFFGFNPDEKLTDSGSLKSDPAYSEFFRDPKVMASFTEHLDISDKLTRKCILGLNEAEQNSVLTALTSKLYDNIVSKIDDIDYGDIPATKGDITALPNYSKIEECVTLLRDILKEYKQDTAPIDEIATAISNVSTRKSLFEKAFKYNVELPIVMYNNVVLTIISSISYMIATTIEFMKTPNRDSFQITLDKVAYAKTKNCMLYNNLKKFNKSCKTGELDKALGHVIEHRVDKLTEAAIGIATGVTIAAAVTLLVLNIVPILREMVFFFYYTRMRVSDFFDIQADLLQMNAYNIENNSAKTNEEKERIVSKQLKIVELFRKAANKISFTGRKAEVESTKEIAANSKKMKIGDLGDDVSDNVASALF